MRELRIRIGIICGILIALLILLAVYASFSVKLYGSRWFANGRNVRVSQDKGNVYPGNVYDRRGILLVSTDQEGKRIYSGDTDFRSSMVHVLGDSQNQVSNGVEKFQARYLYGFDASVLERLKQLFYGQKRRGENISLSIDSQLQNYIANCFKQDNNLKDKNGAVVVLNYKTGEILSLSSFPNFDPMDIPESCFTDIRKPFFNRATQSVMPPGSTFKLISMASFLEKDIKNASYIYVCDGAYEIGTNLIKDAQRASHGELTLNQALAKSCNNYFVDIALKIGDASLRKTAEKFGFNDNFLFKDIVVENSVYPLDKRNNFEIGLTGIGQSSLLASPMHMCLVAAAIANDGQMMEPYLLKSVNTGNKKTFSSHIYKNPIDKDVAKIIKQAMFACVENGTGKLASVDGMRIGGKTGTAEGNNNGRPVEHAWFVGFNDSNSLPIALCIFVEEGGSGGGVAAPLAAKIFDYLRKN